MAIVRNKPELKPKIGYISRKGRFSGIHQDKVFGGINEEKFLCSRIKKGVYHAKGVSTGKSYTIGEDQFISISTANKIISKRYKGEPRTEGSLVRTESGLCKVLSSIVKPHGIFYYVAANHRTRFNVSHDDIIKEENRLINEPKEWIETSVEELSGAKVFVFNKEGSKLLEKQKRFSKIQQEKYEDEEDEEYFGEEEGGF